MNYTYVNSQIKVIEESILDKNDFLKLSKVSKNEFLKTLVDLGYGSSGDSLEKIINNELYNIKKHLDEVSPKKEHTDLFFLLDDAVNIKYLYKLKTFKLRDASMFLNRGNFLEADLRSAILENDYSAFNKDYTKLLTNIEKNVSHITDPRVLSGLIDSMIYDFILKKVRLTFNEPLSTYFKTRIDFSNILSFVRIKNLHWKFEDNKEMFISGGNISVKVIEDLFNLKDEDVIRSLQPYYNEELSKILDDFYKTKDLNILEIKLDRLQLKLMRPFKDDAFGIGIIMYYYLKKLAEAKNIRYIYANPDIDIDNLLEY
ncbi:MAG: V-type ATPase subunit [Bacilli bacterium]|nr:V-type ATPase subunit [Bacilli bacterium]